jgi:PmbA protein
VSRGRLERHQIDRDADSALEIARQASYDDPDAACVAGPSAIPEVELHDASAARIATGDTGDLAARLAAVRRRVERHECRTWSGSFSAIEAETRLVTSAGLDVDSLSTSTGWHVTLDGELGTGFAARAPERLEDFEARLDRLADFVVRLRQPERPIAVRNIEAALLHPAVVESFVIGTLAHALDGANVAHGESHFSAGRFLEGGPVFREDLTLRVNPLIPMRAGSYRFTHEGVPAAPCTYIQNGRLLTPVLNLKYARRLGRPPTSVAYDSDTLFLEGPPTLDLPLALGEVPGCVLVLSVLGAHTQDATSGDFSLAAPQSLAIGTDGLGGRVRATLSGNLFSALRDDTVRLVAFPGEHVPGLLLPCRVQVWDRPA